MLRCLKMKGAKSQLRRGVRLRFSQGILQLSGLKACLDAIYWSALCQKWKQVVPKVTLERCNLELDNIIEAKGERDRSFDAPRRCRCYGGWIPQNIPW